MDQCVNEKEIYTLVEFLACIGCLRDKRMPCGPQQLVPHAN